MPPTVHLSCVQRLLNGRDDVVAVLLHDLDVGFLADRKLVEQGLVLDGKAHRPQEP